MPDDSSIYFETCDHCGARFDQETRYPVVTERNEDGDLQVYSFCEETCLEAWRESR